MNITEEQRIAEYKEAMERFLRINLPLNIKEDERNLQNVHTPIKLCRQIIGKLDCL